MTYGLQDTGFLRPTTAEVITEIQDELRQTIDARLTFDEKDPLAQILISFSDRLALAWEAVEDAFYAFDESAAMGERMVALAELTGTVRRAAGPGSVPCTATISGARDYAAGALVAHEEGFPDRTWRNKDRITTVASGTVNTTFISDATGTTATVAAGKLNKISSAVVGWDAITNAVDATPGTNLETIEQLRSRRRREVQAAGSATLGALIAAVGKVPGVIEATGRENTTQLPIAGLPGKSAQIFVWDGPTPAANNVAIAQAIYNTRATGKAFFGDVTANAVSSLGKPYAQKFSRVTGIRTYPSYLITTTKTITAANVREVATAEFEEMAKIGGTIYYARMLAAPFKLAGVTNVSLILNGNTTNLTVGEFARAYLDQGDFMISITGP